MAQENIICICVYGERDNDRANVVRCQHLGDLGMSGIFVLLAVFL